MLIRAFLKKENMKIEINIENKAKFFAQYSFTVSRLWHTQMDWQYADILQVLTNRSKIDELFHGSKEPELSFWQLPLKPLSSITDEDAIDMARLALYHPTVNEWNDDDVWTGEGDTHPNGDLVLEVGMRCWDGILILNESGAIDLKDDEDNLQSIYQSSAVFDYLRSKGYALPWMGLSVEEMVEAGWIKLK